MTSTRIRAIRHRVMLAAISVVGCSGARDKAATADTTVAPPVTASPSGGDPAAPAAESRRQTDENILAMEAAGDSAEVVLSEIAASNATDAGVRAYAVMLRSDHARGLTETHALAHRLGLVPKPAADDTTEQATGHLAQRFQSLAKGTAFDSAFVNHEIEDHHHDIDDAHKMMATAQNPELKAFINKSLPELQTHLQRGLQLEKSSRRR